MEWQDGLPKLELELEQEQATTEDEQEEEDEEEFYDFLETMKNPDILIQFND